MIRVPGFLACMFIAVRHQSKGRLSARTGVFQPGGAQAPGFGMPGQAQAPGFAGAGGYSDSATQAVRLALDWAGEKGSDRGRAARVL